MWNVASIPGSSTYSEAAFDLSHTSRVGCFPTLEKPVHPREEHASRLPFDAFPFSQGAGIDAKALGGFLLRESQGGSLPDQPRAPSVRLGQWVRAGNRSISTGSDGGEFGMADSGNTCWRPRVAVSIEFDQARMIEIQSA